MEIIARAIIALVFSFSALSKICSTRAWAAFVESVEKIGLSAGRARVAAVVVVTREIAIAIVTVRFHESAYGPSLAIVVLLGFCAIINYSIRSGRKVECRCFGGSSRPFSYAHILRNSILIAVSVLSLVAPDSERIDQLSTAEILLTSLIVLMVSGFIARFDIFAEVLSPSSHK